MSIGRLARISLRVESLRQAENLYTRLFGLEVVCREGMREDEPYAIPGNLTWEEIASAELSPHRSVLYGEGFRLTLYRSVLESSARGRLDRIGLCLEAGEFRRLWEQIEGLGCQVEEVADEWIVFEDPYGVRWEVATE
jgi:catechol 2,3-dioxygenase-like lactoylglutathione lyase family enzyme